MKTTKRTKLQRYDEIVKRNTKWMAIMSLTELILINEKELIHNDKAFSLN